MIKIFLTLALFFGFFSAQAAPKVTVHGTLVSFDSHVAKIKTSEKNVVTVPRKSLKTPTKGLMIGVAVVQAQLSLDEMIKHNGNPFKKK